MVMLPAYHTIARKLGMRRKGSKGKRSAKLAVQVVIYATREITFGMYTTVVRHQIFFPLCPRHST